MTEVAEMPHDLEAEQSLLGIILFDNGAYETVWPTLAQSDFYDPFHGRLYSMLEERIRKGEIAEPICMLESLRRDPAFEELGGIRYLADLIDRSPPSAQAPVYADLIKGHSSIRVLMQKGDPS